MDKGQYKFLLWNLIGALDTGKYDDLDIDEVKQHAKAGTISKYLQERFGADSDFSVYSKDSWKSINDDLANMQNAIDAQRKFGVSNRGIALLMAWALQGIQQNESK